MQHKAGCRNGGHNSNRKEDVAMLPVKVVARPQLRQRGRWKPGIWFGREVGASIQQPVGDIKRPCGKRQYGGEPQWQRDVGRPGKGQAPGHGDCRRIQAGQMPQPQWGWCVNLRLNGGRKCGQSGHCFNFTAVTAEPPIQLACQGLLRTTACGIRA